MLMIDIHLKLLPIFQVKIRDEIAQVTRQAS